MKLTPLSRPLAILALGALAACSGGLGSGAPIPNSSPQPISTPAGGTPLVGIGDSLTAGYQSDGFLGATTATSSASAYPNHAVPPGQENGWWALMYQAVTGASTASMYNPSTSPLPLIAAPGLGTQLVLSSSLFTQIQSGCDPFNDSAYSSTLFAGTRMDAAAKNLDLGIPGITMHEAVAMSAPLTGPPNNTTTCGYNTVATDPTAGGLQSLVSGESELFYPVMGSYIHNVSSLTELNVALALKPKLTTVWLGANDLLKFSFSGGKPYLSDSRSQMSADLTTIVKSLTAGGSKVLVADLPNVLSTPQFFPQGTRLVGDLTTLLTVATGNATAAQAYATQISTFLGNQYGVTAGGYLTESGFLAIIQNCETNPSQCLTPQLDPSGTGSGLGAYYLTPAFAGEVAAMNTAYNQAIDAVATGSGSNVALVPITQLFDALAPTATTTPNLSTIDPGAPSATLQFGGNLVSWDGLHPSNLGYAVIANSFIETADQAFGMTLTPLSNAQLGAIAAADPYNGTTVDALAFGGAPVFPLP